jgi:Ni/Co efflux regulator RcnB
MKKIFTAVLGLSLLASSAVYAQNHDRDGRDGRDGRDNSAQRDDRGHGPQARDDHRDDRRDDHRDGGHIEGRNDRMQYAQHDNGPRGAGPRHDLRRGQRVPNDYRGNQYVVDDWRGHHLTKPPRGHHWVQAGNDYVLVAVATGVIAQVLLNN